MSRPSSQIGLTFEEAMAVHVLRAQGVMYHDLTYIFRANPARFSEILSADAHPGSWEEAVRRLQAGENWHPEVERVIMNFGRPVVLAAVVEANPSKRRFQRQLKRIRRSSSFVGRGVHLRPTPRR